MICAQKSPSPNGTANLTNLNNLQKTGNNNKNKFERWNKNENK